MGRLQDRVAIVTGAASGIGRASAELFAAEGARVIAVDRPESNLDYDSTAITPVAVDLATADAPDRVMAAVEPFGHLDILFNNAGVSNKDNVVDTSDETWDRVQDVNLKAYFRLCRAAIPKLTASPFGRIVNTASVMAQGTDWGLAAYCASKAGVLGLTRTLALNSARRG